jgi:hypothetical protein
VKRRRIEERRIIYTTIRVARVTMPNGMLRRVSDCRTEPQKKIKRKQIEVIWMSGKGPSLTSEEGYSP